MKTEKPVEYINHFGITSINISIFVKYPPVGSILNIILYIIVWITEDFYLKQLFRIIPDLNMVFFSMDFFTYTIYIP